MTDADKKEIQRLRLAGYGYVRIAQMLVLSENSVKSFCRRNPLQTSAPQSRAKQTCPQCGKSISENRRFCSDACRTACGTLIGSIGQRRCNPALPVSTAERPSTDIPSSNRNIAATLATLLRGMGKGVKAVDEATLSYVSAMATARQMRKINVLTDDEYQRVEEAMREKYNVPKDSIFRDFDLLCPRFRAMMSHHKEVAECQ